MRKSWGFLAVILVAAMLLVSCRPTGAPKAATKEPYKIGVIASLTGGVAVASLPQAEGFRVYMQRLNNAGGIDGHPVQISIEDSQADPIRAASIMRKFEGQGVHIVYNNDASSTFSPTIQEAKRINIPVVTAFIAPPEALPPNPNPLIYEASHGITALSSYTYLDAMKYLTPNPKVGLLATEIPGSLTGVQNLDKEAKRMGIPSLMKVIPMGTADITPVAQAFMDWGANWVYYFGPGAFSSMLFDALQKAGWKGNLMDQTTGLSFELFESRYKGNTNIYIATSYLPYSENLPAHKEIIETAKKYGASNVNSLNILGWYNAKAIAEVFKKAGWPVTTDKLVKVMQNLRVDRSPVMGPLIWTPQDHAGNFTFRVYHWKGDKFISDGPWFVTDALGQNRFTVKELKEIK